MADLDIHAIGEDFIYFLYYSIFGIATEIGNFKNNFKLKNGKNIEDIFNYWKNNDITYSEFKNFINN